MRVKKSDVYDAMFEFATAGYDSDESVKSHSDQIYGEAMDYFRSIDEGAYAGFKIDLDHWFEWFKRQ